jgi:dienelactone hydrolase
MGTSFGAVSAIFASTQPIDGLKGVVAFATTTMWQDSNGKQNPCRADVLESYLKELAPKAKVPVQFMYSVNDSYSSPAHQAKWFAAFQNSGAPKNTEFVQFKEMGNEGHLLFSVYPDQWITNFKMFVEKVNAEASSGSAQ